MIASFKQPRYSLLFAAMIVAVGLVTLTDAQAHEPRTMHFRVDAAPSPEAQVFVQSLEKNMTVDLRSASVHDTLSAITSVTGVSFTAADGVIDPSLRLNVKAENIPAHMVLIESASAAGLAVKFTDSGVELLKGLDELEARVRAAQPGEERVMFMRRVGGDVTAAPLRNPEELRKLEGTRAFRIDAAKDSNLRKVTIMGEDGEKEGTLQIEVVK